MQFNTNVVCNGVVSLTHRRGNQTLDKKVFHNLLTDLFFKSLISGNVDANIELGSGTDVPKVNDTSLKAAVMTSRNTVTITNNSVAYETYPDKLASTLVYKQTHQVKENNVLAELGLVSTDGLLARSLIKDEANNVTQVDILVDDYIDIIWTINFYYPKQTINSTVPVRVNKTTTPYNIAISILYNEFLSNNAFIYSDDMVAYNFYDKALEIANNTNTSTPTYVNDDTTVMSVGQMDGNNNFVVDAHLTGKYGIGQLSFSMYLNADECNYTNGIKAIAIHPNVMLPGVAYEFSEQNTQAGLPKTNIRNMIFYVTYTFSRG